LFQNFGHGACRLIKDLSMPEGVVAAAADDQVGCIIEGDGDVRDIWTFE
jgi:hypothetical protein